MSQNSTSTPTRRRSQTIEDLSEQVRVRYEKLGRIRERRENPYKNGFSLRPSRAIFIAQYDAKTKEELEGARSSQLRVAGRIMAIRDFGKASFVRVERPHRD